MDRIINVKVGGNHLSKDNKNAGVRGEGNVTSLRITFDEGWDGYAKTVTFYDSLGQNPVKRVETVDLIEDITTDHRTYITPIPPEPLAIAGELTFVIDGYKDGKRQRSVSDTLIVKDAPMTDNATEPSEPTPTQAEQLQKQIDGMIDKVQQMYIDGVNSKQNAENAKASEENAEESERIARECAEIAQNSVGKVSYIGENGNWFAWSDSGFYDTGVKAQAGSTVRSGNNPPDEADVPEDCDIYIDLNGDATSEQIKEAVEDYLSEHPIDVDVPNWAMQPNKPTYTAGEVGAYDKKYVDDTVSRINTSQSIVQDMVSGLQKQVMEESHFRGYLSTNAKIQELQATPNDFAYSAESGTKWVYDAKEGWQDTGKAVPDQLTPASTSTPLMNGEASVGQENTYARGDHRHPHDVTKVDKTEFDTKIGDIEETLEEHGQELSKKLEETVLHEEVVNTPEWQNQPTYEGNLAIDTSDFYYVTLKNTDGTALPSGQFKLMPMYDKYAEAYETVFTLDGLKTGNSGTLTENLPVEFTMDYKMRTAGVERVAVTMDLPTDSSLGKLTIETTGQFIKKSKVGYFASNFTANKTVAHYNSGNTTTSNSEGDRNIWHFVNNQGDDYKIGKFVDTLELQMNGEKSFITHRHSLLRYISYGTTTYKNIPTDSVGFGFILSENTKIIEISSYAVTSGYIRNGSVFTVTEVK